MPAPTRWQTALTYTLALNFENLTLTGTDNVNATGNALDNILTGNAGNNILNGLVGADTMLGGLGNDTYVLDNAGDIVNDSGGIDTIQSSVSVDLTDAVHVVGDIETLTLTGTAAINGIGNALDNLITGNGANNLIEGGLGADTLDGGLGTDTLSYAHSAAGVLVSLLTTAQVSTGDASGDILKNFENITGSAFADTLTGNTLANLLDGGAGADTLVGGAGNDIYILDNAGDVVDEVSNGGAGIDTIQSGVSHTVETDVENLTLTGTGNIDGTGNTLANLITGNAGNNILDGGLDVLADTLSGGLGNDTYIVRAGDVLVEAVNAGTDTVQTALTYTLALNFENLTLTGTDNVNATGNALDNILTGNAGNNILNGLIGADTMLGGLGNDTYVLDNAGDIVNDSGGSDTIQSSVTVDLTDAVHVVGDIETLTLTGTAAINGIGNALANTITAMVPIT